MQCCLMEMDRLIQIQWSNQEMAQITHLTLGLKYCYRLVGVMRVPYMISDQKKKVQGQWL